MFTARAGLPAACSYGNGAIMRLGNRLKTSAPYLPLVVAAVALPPPVHGQAVVCARVLNHLTGLKNCRLAVFDLSPRRLQRGIGYHCCKMRAVIWAGGGLLMQRRHQASCRTFYAVPDAGWGLFYTLLLVLLARLASYRCVLHHHSAAQVRRPRRLLALVMRLAGADSRQVVLSPAMASDLRQNYPWLQATQIQVAGNAVHVTEDVKKPRANIQQGPLRLGMLSNLSVAKGAVLALETAIEAQQQGLDITLTLAGPVVEPTVAKQIAAARDILGARLAMPGALTGAAKQAFFSQIDVLLFPTRYALEAQPLVVLEALQAGKPVVVFDQGYIREMLGNDQETPGLLIGTNADFVATALPWLQRVAADRQALKGYHQLAGQRFAVLHQTASTELKSLLDLLVGKA